MISGTHEIACNFFFISLLKDNCHEPYNVLQAFLKCNCFNLVVIASNIHPNDIHRTLGSLHNGSPTLLSLSGNIPGMSWDPHMVVLKQASAPFKRNQFGKNKVIGTFREKCCYNSVIIMMIFFKKCIKTITYRDKSTTTKKGLYIMLSRIQ